MSRLTTLVEMAFSVTIGANWHGAMWERANRDVAKRERKGEAKGSEGEGGRERGKGREREGE